MIITEYNEEWDKEAQRKYYTERALELGREQGRAQGLELGREQGRAQGLELGRAEEKLDVVRNLLTMNLPLEKISRAVGLPEEEILKLSKE